MNHKTKIVNINNIVVSNDSPFVLIAGPCVLESKDHAFFMCEELVKITKELGIPFIYKSSYDKANRTSLTSKRGVGLKESVKIFQEIKNKFNVPIITDVHESNQCAEVAEVVDILQIPAFLCRQTDLLLAAANTNRAVNIKKGQFLHPREMSNIVAKIESTNNRNILLCERGNSFGYNHLVVDMTSLDIMAKTGYPVIFDMSHSVQQPGSLVGSTGGQREFSPILARAALGVGVAGIFMETHNNPDQAFSDGATMTELSKVKNILQDLIKIDRLIKSL